ncbi:cytochrome P450, partial [Streptococcus pseudopneumoniae]|uniref:cytochrome P450 n=1 Tax=Streptococcus pseudopneumoniae TaxID=257758 RepID=UPI0018B0A07F
DPSLAANAVEKALRWDGPSHYQGRFVERDVEIDGVTIPADSRVVLLTGAASHDDRVFDAPELFDIHRSIERNVAFGWGIHLC